MSRKKSKKLLNTADLNLDAILINANKAALTYGLTERGARGFHGRGVGSSDRPQKRLYRKKSSYISR